MTEHFDKIYYPFKDVIIDRKKYSKMYLSSVEGFTKNKIEGVLYDNLPEADSSNGFKLIEEPFLITKYFEISEAPSIKVIKDLQVIFETDDGDYVNFTNFQDTNKDLYNYFKNKYTEFIKCPCKGTLSNDDDIKDRSIAHFTSH